MNNGILIFLGLLLTMLWSWYGFVVQNFKQVGRQEPAKLITGEADMIELLRGPALDQPVKDSAISERHSSRRARGRSRACASGND